MADTVKWSQQQDPADWSEGSIDIDSAFDMVCCLPPNRLDIILLTLEGMLKDCLDGTMPIKGDRAETADRIRERIIGMHAMQKGMGRA